jgi:hypothetical protein
LICVLAAFAAFAQDEVPPPVIEEVYLARDDGNGKAGEEVKEFRTTDVPIHCVVLLNASAKVTVKMNFVAVNVAGVRAETKVVTASYTTAENQDRVYFTGRPDGKWTPGRYRVDLFVNSKPAGKVEFDIKAPTGNVLAAKFAVPAAPAPKPKPTKATKKPE